MFIRHFFDTIAYVNDYMICNMQDYLKGIVKFLSQLILIVLFLLSCRLHAQDLEPRTYGNVPIRMNFFVAGAGYTSGAVIFDPTIPLDNAKIKINAFVMAYARTLKLGKMTGKVDVVIPYAVLSGTADVNGQQVSRNVAGFGDTKVSMSVNFIGAPPLSLAEFKDYKQKVVVGARLQAYLPLSQYDPQRLVNIGTNRFAFKPEVGISKKFGRLFLEAAGGAAIYTTNNDFYIDKTLLQSPIGFFQSHAIYTFKKGIWVALDGTYYWGGSTTVNGVKGDNLQKNSRVGITCALPLSVHQSIKLNLSTGVWTRTGSDFNVIFLAWQYRWGRDLKKKMKD